MSATTTPKQIPNPPIKTSTNSTPQPSPKKTHLRPRQLPFIRFMALNPCGIPTTYSRRRKLDRVAVKKSISKLAAQPFYQAADEELRKAMRDILERCVEAKRRKRGLHVSCMFLGYGKPIRSLEVVGGGVDATKETPKIGEGDVIVIDDDDDDMDMSVEDGDREEDMGVIVIDDDKDFEEDNDETEEKIPVEKGVDSKESIDPIMRQKSVGRGGSYRYIHTHENTGVASP